MISKAIRRICEDYTKIENYEQAINDETQIWECHHRLETHFSDGTERPKNAQISIDELKALRMYFDRPAEELIFLTKAQHLKLHHIGLKASKSTRQKISKASKGKCVTDETRTKIAEAQKGQKRSEYTKMKMSTSHKGKLKTEEHKRKLSEAMRGRHKGEHWKMVDGKRVFYKDEEKIND